MRLALPVIVSVLIVLATYVPAISQVEPIRPPLTSREYTWTDHGGSSDKIVSDGRLIRIIHAEGLSVAAAARPTEDGLMYEIYVFNATGHRILLDPTGFYVAYSDEGRIKWEHPLSPDAIAAKHESGAEWGNFFRSFAAGMAKQRSTTQTMGSGNVSVMSNDGVASGMYTATSTSMTIEPNTQAQQNAATANRNASAQAAERAMVIRNTALRPNTVLPDESLLGYVYFKRQKADIVVVNIVVEDINFMFWSGYKK